MTILLKALLPQFLYDYDVTLLAYALILGTIITSFPTDTKHCLRLHDCELRTVHCLWLWHPDILAPRAIELIGRTTQRLGLDLRRMLMRWLQRGLIMEHGAFFIQVATWSNFITYWLSTDLRYLTSSILGRSPPLTDLPHWDQPKRILRTLTPFEF